MMASLVVPSSEHVTDDSNRDATDVLRVRSSTMRDDGEGGQGWKASSKDSTSLVGG